jgi:hypothetical protein
MAFTWTILLIRSDKFAGVEAYHLAARLPTALPVRQRQLSAVDASGYHSTLPNASHDRRSP